MKNNIVRFSIILCSVILQIKASFKDQPFSLGIDDILKAEQSTNQYQSTSVTNPIHHEKRSLVLHDAQERKNKVVADLQPFFRAIYNNKSIKQEVKKKNGSATAKDVFQEQRSRMFSAALLLIRQRLPECPHEHNDIIHRELTNFFYDKIPAKLCSIQ